MSGRRRRGPASTPAALTCSSFRDVLCGKLFCHGGLDSPTYGRMVRFGACKAAFFDDYTQDYGQVQAGTRCGEGKVSVRLRAGTAPRQLCSPGPPPLQVCSQNECVELHAAYRNTNCSAKCSGHGVSPADAAQPARRAGPSALTACVFAQVCNHKNACQCEPGWVPPDCTTTDASLPLGTSKWREGAGALLVRRLMSAACLQRCSSAWRSRWCCWESARPC